MLAVSPVDNRAVILDCCFSGRAIGDLAGGEQAVVGQLGIEGAYILTATVGNALALAPVGHRYAAFTDALLTLLHTGGPDGPPLLTFAALYPRLRALLASRGMPQPHQ